MCDVHIYEQALKLIAPDTVTTMVSENIIRAGTAGACTTAKTGPRSNPVITAGGVIVGAHYRVWPLFTVDGEPEIRKQYNAHRAALFKKGAGKAD